MLTFHAICFQTSQLVFKPITQELVAPVKNLSNSVVITQSVTHMLVIFRKLK